MKWFAIMLVALLLVGCQPNREAQLIGAWKGEYAQSPAAGENPLESLGNALASGLVGSLSAEFRADRTFTMNVILPIEGTWKLEGDKVILTPTKIMNMTPTEAETKDAPSFQLSPDGKTLTLVEQDSVSKTQLKFTKTQG